MWPLIIFSILFNPASTQFAEIASLATSLLGSGLGPALGGAAAAGSAAAPGLGALSQIGQLYQLAQGALQLTGTGVGVLNQASEGNWFPAVLEQASKSTKNLMGGGHGFGGPPNLGALGPMPIGNSLGGGGSSQIGPEFGTGFPAPKIEDYTDEQTEVKATTKAPESLVNIDDNDFDELPSTSASTPTIPVTLFPDESESNSVTEPTTAAPLKEIRIELPKNTGASTDNDYIDQVTTDGDSRVQVTNKEKNDGDENLLQPDRASAAKTLNAKIRTGVPDLTKLIDVLRKSNLKEAEIMEIVSQVEGNDNNAPPPKIDFTSAVQNIPLKKHLNRERIVKASREIQKSIEPHEKAVEAHFNNLRQIPDFAAAATATPNNLVPTTAAPHPTLLTQAPPHPPPDFIATNRLQREIASRPIEKSVFPQATAQPNPLLLLPQQQYTTPPNYFLHNPWQHPQFPHQQLPGNNQQQSSHLYQPQPQPQPQPLIQPSVHPLFQHNPYVQLPNQQQYQQQQQQHYAQQVQQLLQPQPAVPGSTQILQQQQQQQHQLTQQLPQQLQQQRQPHHQQYQLQQQQQQQQQQLQQQQLQHQQRQQQVPPTPQNLYYPGQQQVYHQYSTQQQVIPQQQQPYRQFRQVSGRAYTAQERPVIFTNQPLGTPAEYNRASYLALSAPTQQGNVQTQKVMSSQIVPRSIQQGQSHGKTRGAGYTSYRYNHQKNPAPSAHSIRSVAGTPQIPSAPVRENRSIVTPHPPRRYPARTARTQRITTPAPVRAAAAAANQLPH